jgi:hypothetical protein
MGNDAIDQIQRDHLRILPSPALVRWRRSAPPERQRASLARVAAQQGTAEDSY